MTYIDDNFGDYEDELDCLAERAIKFFNDQTDPLSVTIGADGKIACSTNDAGQFENMWMAIDFMEKFANKYGLFYAVDQVDTKFLVMKPEPDKDWGWYDEYIGIYKTKVQGQAIKDESRRTRKKHEEIAEEKKPSKPQERILKMSKGKLSRLDIEVAALFICEDEEHRLHLCRQIFPEEIHVVHLYRVSFFREPREEIFVLAPSEAEAISQATCLIDRDEDEATALQVKVMVRGWSRNVF